MIVTIEVHLKIPRTILGTRLNVGSSATKDGAHPRNQLTDTLPAYHQVYAPIILIKTVLILAGEASLLHGDDGNCVQRSDSTEVGDGIGSTVENNQRWYTRFRLFEGNRLHGHHYAAIPARF